MLKYLNLKQVASAALVMASLSAHAGLTTYAPWDATFSGNGLAGVLFNVQSAQGVTVALGAHAYKNGVFLPNNGSNTFTAASGTYQAESRANWSFDFAYDLGTSCTGCTVTLMVDVDPTSGVLMRNLFSTNMAPVSGMDSWNMEMSFNTGNFALAPGNAFVANPYDFNPFENSSTAFALEVRNANGALITETSITVDVPEPTSLALAGLALAAIGATRRRRA